MNLFDKGLWITKSDVEYFNSLVAKIYICSKKEVIYMQDKIKEEEEESISSKSSLIKSRILPEPMGSDIDKIVNNFTEIRDCYYLYYS